MNSKKALEKFRKRLDEILIAHIDYYDKERIESFIKNKIEEEIFRSLGFNTRTQQYENNSLIYKSCKKIANDILETTVKNIIENYELNNDQKEKLEDNFKKQYSYLLSHKIGMMAGKLAEQYVEENVTKWISEINSNDV